MNKNTIINWWVTDEGNKEYNKSLVSSNGSFGLSILDSCFVEFTPQYCGMSEEEIETEIEYREIVE